MRRRFVCLHFMNVGQLQLSSGNSAPNSGNNHHLIILFEGGMPSFKRQGACVKGKAPVGRLLQKSKWSRSDRYIPPSKTWSVVLLNKKNAYTPISSVLCMTSC